MLAKHEALLKTHRGQLATQLAGSDYLLIADLVQKRIDSGFTQAQVAEKLSITQQAVSKFESLETDPRLSTIRKYALVVNALITHKIVDATPKALVKAKTSEYGRK